ncbi:hypothetical protein HWV62_27115 [Athelia sp. TMB]|nr:hypothetical protein HWV62_27115 [Athelia sp. TMB]
MLLRPRVRWTGLSLSIVRMRISMLPIYSVIALSIIAAALLLLSAMHFATALCTVAIAVLLTRGGDGGAGLVYPDYFLGLFRSSAIEYAVGKYQPRDVHGQPNSEYASNMGSDVGNTKCHTTRTGYFHAGTSHWALGISGDTIHWPVKADAKPLRVQFQRCPQLTQYGTPTGSNYWGRIVVVETVEAASMKANQCLTSSPSSTVGILYLKITNCGSEDVPAPDQSWVYSDKSPGNEIFFAGFCSKQSGYAAESDGKPSMTHNSVTIGCVDNPGVAIGFFTLLDPE